MGLSISTGSLAEGGAEFAFNLLYKPFKYLINNYLRPTVLVGTKYKEHIQSSELLLGLFDPEGEGTTTLRNIENYSPYDTRQYDPSKHREL